MITPSPQRESIELAIDAWARAWNRHDADALTNLVREDVDFVTVAGLWLSGAPAFAAHHRRIHDGPMRTTRWTTHAHTKRLLRPDLVLVHLEWTIAGERAPDNTALSDRPGIFTWLLIQEGGDWRILAAHNTNLRADVRHRLDPEGEPQ